MPTREEIEQVVHELWEDVCFDIPRQLRPMIAKAIIERLGDYFEIKWDADSQLVADANSNEWDLAVFSGFENDEEEFNFSWQDSARSYDWTLGLLDDEDDDDLFGFGIEDD